MSLTRRRDGVLKVNQNFNISYENAVRVRSMNRSKNMSEIIDNFLTTYFGLDEESQVLDHLDSEILTTQARLVELQDAKKQKDEAEKKRKEEQERKLAEGQAFIIDYPA